jgi:hypothetical protein
MLINIKKININCVIGILLILVIIYILYNKKQEVFTGNYPNLSLIDGLEAQLDELVLSCFEELQEPISVAPFLTKELLTNTVISEEISLKLFELISLPLYMVVKVFRIRIIDFKCGNSEGETFLNKTLEYLLKIVKSLTIVFREILDISSDNTTTLPPLNFDDNELIRQIGCLRKKYLPYDDNKILNEYDFNNLEIDQTSSAYTFTTKLYEFIMKLSLNQSSDECLGVDLTEESNVLSSYIYTDGSERTCNSKSSPTTPTIPTIPNAPTNNLPNGINLINSQGPNNFFLPNIRIS